ncbi:hypothetical protein WL78_23970 [Burkholderia ubonensis]|uniref:DUF5681 domain-containing protein n=1 Tax=Burkholderia ubonensis TaxID=101571 RepID=UPI000758FD31|nr:DUF5681 domain-containing protein [Burkholderia ubonensis]KVO84036.1 hypothetical protein WJ80_18485 [Burkholderia ubonensis]KVP18855.1 hypothetical protein WJ84_00345 [Burkholderia ubonensis]KVR24004.1 hypothetical protein WK14_17310 [Burkholderia ubonensis]KWD25610.1 hypothetical protein WL61_03265 [Burkholderia ubonensis]KWD27618.1 hypothetical protein WL62_08565 [Burkholderia ubonensis]
MTQFKKGQSGNPAGKPKGARDKRTALRELLQPHAADLVAKAVELAKAGDTTALRICIDRCIPAIKAKDAPVDLPDLTGSLAEQGQAVMRAMAAGRITPDEANAVMQVISAQARIIEVDEFEKRLAVLENKDDGNHQSQSTH